MDRNFLDGIANRPYTVPASQLGSNGKRGVSGNTASDGSPSFADVLQQQFQGSEGVKFSAHAMSRLEQRGVKLSREDMQQIGAAVDKAGQKGARDAYLVYGSAGFVVNVPNRTVVTAMVHDSGTVVTNIDSVVFVSGPDR